MKYTFSMKLCIEISEQPENINQMMIPGIETQKSPYIFVINKMTETSFYKYGKFKMNIEDKVISNNYKEVLLKVTFDTDTVNDTVFWIDNPHVNEYLKENIKKMFIFHKKHLGMTEKQTREMLKSKYLYIKIRHHINKVLSRIGSKYKASGYIKYTEMDELSFDSNRFYRFGFQGEK